VDLLLHHFHTLTVWLLGHPVGFPGVLLYLGLPQNQGYVGGRICNCLGGDLCRVFWVSVWQHEWLYQMYRKSPLYGMFDRFDLPSAPPARERKTHSASFVSNVRGVRDKEDKLMKRHSPGSCWVAPRGTFLGGR